MLRGSNDPFGIYGGHMIIFAPSDAPEEEYENVEFCKGKGLRKGNMR